MSWKKKRPPANVMHWIKEKKKAPAPKPREEINLALAAAVKNSNIVTQMDNEPELLFPYSCQKNISCFCFF